MSTNGLALDDGNYKLKASTTGTGSESASTPCSTAEHDLSMIREAIKQYHEELNNRKHGGVAADHCLWRIQEILNMHWIGNNKR